MLNQRDTIQLETEGFDMINFSLAERLSDETMKMKKLEHRLDDVEVKLKPISKGLGLLNSGATTDEIIQKINQIINILNQDLRKDMI